MKYKDDVIIIGAGIGSLSAGAYLSRLGYKIKIFESRDKPGGVMHSFKRDNYFFEATTHQLCGFKNNLYLKKTLSLLGIKDIPLRELDFSFESNFFNSDYKITKSFLIKAGFKEATLSLSKYFPEHKEIINNHFKLIKGLSIDLLKLKRLYRELPLSHPIDMIFALMLMNFNKNKLLKMLSFQYYKYVIKFRDKSSDILFNSIKDQDLKYLLSQHSFFMGIRPEESSAYLMAIIIYLYLLNKPNSIVGGTNTLIESLVNVISKHKGQINYNSKVKEILIRDNKAFGIKLENNEEIYGKFIISGTPIVTTFNDLIKNHSILNKNFINKLKSYKPSISAIHVFVGLPFKLDDYGIKSSTTFFSQSNNFNDFLKGDTHPNENSSFFLTDYSKYNPECFPENKTSIIIQEFDNINRWNKLDQEKYKKLKNETEDIILNKVSKLTSIPFKKADLVFSSTPRTVNQYSSNPWGSLYGAEQNVNQSFLYRFNQQSPVNNLFITGADSKPSGGVSACLDSGVMAVNLIKKCR